MWPGGPQAHPQPTACLTRGGRGRVPQKAPPSSQTARTLPGPAARTGLPPTPQVRGRLGFGLRAEPGGNVREWKALLFQLRPPEGAPSPQTPRPPRGPRPAAEEGKGQLKQDAVADTERGRLLPYPEGLPFRPAASGSVVRLGLGEGSRLDSTGVLSRGSGHHGSVWPPLWSSGNPRSAELGYPTAAVQLAALSAPSAREDRCRCPALRKDLERSEPVNTGGTRYLGNVVRKPEGMQDRPHRLPPPPQFLERAGQTETSSLLRGDGKWCCRFQCPMANILISLPQRRGVTRVCKVIGGIKWQNKRADADSIQGGWAGALGGALPLTAGRCWEKSAFGL